MIIPLRGLIDRKSKGAVHVFHGDSLIKKGFIFEVFESNTNEF